MFYIAKKINLNVRLRKFSLNYFRQFSTQLSVEEKSEEQSLTAKVSKLKNVKEPFVKNLFLGKVDRSMLLYPESLNLERYNKLENLTSTVNNICNQISNVDDLKKKLNLMNELNLDNITNTELSKIYEELSSFDTSFILSIENQRSVCDIVEKLGTIKQKEKYLKKLKSAEIIGAFALTEQKSGSDLGSMMCDVKFNGNSGDGVINGEKVWITNANIADIFIVFVSHRPRNLAPHVVAEREIAAYLIEKKDVDVQKMETSLKSVNNFGKIVLKNINITSDDLILGPDRGYDVLNHWMNQSKDLLNCHMLYNLKRFFKKVLSYLKFRCDNLETSELVQKNISKIACTIYAIESMIYFVNGFKDSYIIDTELETVIIRLFCNQYGLNAFSKCLDLLGPNVFCKENEPDLNMYNDLKALSVYTKTNDVFKLYISMLGIKFVGQYIKETIDKTRNPFNYPGFVFKRMVNDSFSNEENPKLTLQLYMELHASLRQSADIVETSILRFKKIVETVLSRHGTEVVHRQLELVRIADIIVDIFAMISMISRASRSYCTGIRHSDQEILLTNNFCMELRKRINSNINFVRDGCLLTGDLGYLRVSNNVFRNGYLFEHPLFRNIT